MERQKIKAWLESIQRDREWLAGQIGTTKATVDGWFSTRGFPRQAVKTIERLMRESTLAKEGRVLATFTTDEFEEIEAARDLVGRPPRPQFYHDAIMDYSQAIITRNRSRKVVTLRNAEEPAEQRVAEPPAAYGRRAASKKDQLKNQAAKIGLPTSATP